MILIKKMKKWFYDEKNQKQTLFIEFSRRKQENNRNLQKFSFFTGHLQDFSDFSELTGFYEIRRRLK